FILRLDKKDEILAGYALEALEKGYQAVGQDLAYFPERKVLVEIYPTSEDFNFTSSLSKRDMETSGAIGICKFNRLMIVSPRCLAFGFRWLDALVHEYTHFVVNRKSNIRCPLWLHEGIARFEEKRWFSGNRRDYLTPVDSSLLKQALDDHKMISFEKMSPSLVKLESQREVALAFAEVASAVDYLATAYRPQILPEILEKLKENPDYKTVIAELINNSYKKFEEGWLNFIKEMNLTVTPGIILESFKIKDDKIDYEAQVYLDVRLADSMRLGDMFHQRGKLEIALEQYKKALKLQPYNPVVLNRLGKTCAELNDFKQAEAAYKEAIKMNPNYVTSYTNLGDLYFCAKDTVGALANYQKSNCLNPFNPAIHKNMGLIYYQTERQKAIEEWKVAAGLDPRDLELQGWLMNSR
ncbi:MAG: tetratricopeptide repeat protein, partial [bacterium]